MATFYKYAERSAESQVNWAEIGKNMTDMLRDEVALREEKKAALDEATRKYAEQLSNAPQGEHVGAKEEALRFADQASQYMLQQERLLKSGLLKPKDYMVARQNLVDGTTRGFKSMKEFQAQYGELMERARTDKSSILEIQALEEIQGYGNFRQSGFFIDAPTGKVNVGLKEEQNINGQKVMGLKDGSTRGMEYVDGAIYTRIDKFRVRESLTPIADSLGVEIQSTLDPATLNKLGSITSVEDLRNRKDIDPETGQILFDYYTSLRDSVGAVISSPFQKASLLADTLGVQVTMDPNVAAKDPNLILKVVDPNTGRAEYKFSEQLEKKAEDYMTQQLLSMVTRKEEIKTGGQVELQERRPRTEAEMGRAEKKANATNVAENLIFATTGDANQSDAGTKFITGLTGLPLKKLKDGISITDENGNLQTFKLRADGKTLADPLGFIKSFIGPITRKTGLNQEDVLREVKRLLPQGAQLNETTVASGFDEQAEEQAPLDELNTIVSESIQTPKLTPYLQRLTSGEALTEQFNKFISPKLSGVKFDYNAAGNVFVDVNGVESEGYKVGDPAKNKAALKNLQDFIIKTYAKGGTAEEQEMAAEAVLSLFPKTSRKTGGVMGGY
jgi:hypothetical protein